MRAPQQSTKPTMLAAIATLLLPAAGFTPPVGGVDRMHAQRAASPTWCHRQIIQGYIATSTKIGLVTSPPFLAAMWLYDRLTDEKGRRDPTHERRWTFPGGRGERRSAG